MFKKKLYNFFKKFGYEVRKTDKNQFIYNPKSYIDKERRPQGEHLLKNDGYSVFFGYHDKNPFSLDGTKILANRVKESGSSYECECSSEMEVGYFRKENNSFGSGFKKIGHTFTWSWQQGCMLQWNPVKPNSQVYFNTLVNNKHGAVLYDLDSSEIIQKLNLPVYSISPNGDVASSINFRRVAEFRPGYGYKNFSDQSTFEDAPATDGIYLIDLNTNETELVIRIHDLADYSEYGAPQYINHVRFSPDGKHFLFFHIVEGTGGKRIISFYLYNIPEKELTLLESSRTVSHFCWRNSKEILTSEIGKGFTYYFLYNVEEKTKISVPLADIGDIHPMVSPTNQNNVILDTKPDVNRYQHLFLFDLSTSSLEHIHQFKLPGEFKDAVRCDLHPRWDTSGKYVCIDTAEERYRTMTVLRLFE